MGQSILTLSIALIIWCGAAHAQSPTASNNARQYVIGEAQGLRIVAWIKEEANLADDDWFRLEINNSGPDVVVRRAAIVAAAEYGGNTRDDLIALPLDIPASGRAAEYETLVLPVGSLQVRNETFVVPAGRFITSMPGKVIATRLSPRYFGASVTMRLSFTVDRPDADPIVLSNPEVITFQWSKPTAQQLESLKRQTSDLLRRVFALPEEQSLKLTALLEMDEIRESVAIDEVLAAVSKRQDAQKYEHLELLWVMVSRWQTEPKVVEFFRAALREGRRGAVRDLASIGDPPWDDSLLEPIVSLVERTSLEESREPHDQLAAVSSAIEYLDRTHARWSHDPTIAPRLSAAVLRLDPAPEPDAMYFWSQLLGMTHDPAMIKVLRPYLTDRTIDSATLTGSQYPPDPTPWRFSELAANAICHLLGEPPMFWDRPRAPKGGPYPVWAVWDKKLAALRQRLDKMGR